MHFNFFFTLLIYCFIQGCTAHSHSIQSAKIVEPKTQSMSFYYHYNASHDENIIKKRITDKLSVDRNKTLSRYGLALSYRFLLMDSMDAGGMISLDTFELDVKYNFFKSDKHYISGGLKLGSKFMSMLDGLFEGSVVTNTEMFSYNWTPVLYYTYEAHKKISLFLNPFYSLTPRLHPMKQEIGSSIGVLLGKKQQWVLGYTYSELLGREIKKSKEQYTVGYQHIVKEAKIPSELEETDNNISVLLGVPAWPIIGPGILGRIPIDDKANILLSLEYGTALSYGKLKDRYNTILSGFMYKVEYERIFDPISLIFGIGKRDIFIEKETNSGWKYIGVKTYGLDFAFSSKFLNVEWQWAGVYVPLALKPITSVKYEGWNDESSGPEEIYTDTARWWSYHPSFSLLKASLAL